MGARNYNISPNGDKWKVQGEGASRPLRNFDTQHEAIDYGRNVARNQGSQLTIRRPNGTIRDRDSHGRDNYPPKG